MKKQRVFLTGAGGTMGGAALEEFIKPEQKKRFELVLLDLPTKKNIKKLNPIADKHGVEIIWGDLTNYEDVLKGVINADFVLHAAAFIPPAADHFPDKAMEINIGAARNIVKAIKAQPDPDSIKLVNIGTVAETGDRTPPIHVGRTGDPIMPSVFDMYAVSKVEAERIIAESGLKYWVSLRQTFILTPKAAPNPIMFHAPLNTCFEACSIENAGLVLLNVTDPDLPDDFWRRFYNIGDGPLSRFTYAEFMKKTSEISGFDYKNVYQRNWFSIQNFHCQYFEDSWVLNEYLDHQKTGLEDFYKIMENQTSLLQRWFTKLMPDKFLKERVFVPFASATPDATQYWIKNNNALRVAAFFGSHEAHAAIGDWDELPPTPDGSHFQRLDHGYDEEKPESDLTIKDMQIAAEFRGGKCLSPSMKTGDLYGKLSWECGFGHAFEATPNIVLKGGHWCPDCAPPAWNYDEQAKVSPFIAQSWYAHHSPDENNYYPEDCVYDLQEKLKVNK